MEKKFSNETVEEILSFRLPKTKDFQKCSFITPDGQYLVMFEHYEAYKFLVVEELVNCIPDAEHLLSDLGWIRYSWIGYITLPTKKLTSAQYKTLEEALIQISKDRDVICIQDENNPKFYLNMSLDDIPYIIKSIKYFYATGTWQIKGE